MNIYRHTLDRLAKSLGGDQKIIAVHRGVEIETVRPSR